MVFSSGHSLKKIGLRQTRYGSYIQIEQLGFKYNAKEGSWYLVIDGIDPTVFIENYESETLEDALSPFETL